MSKCVQNMWPPKLDMSKDECRGTLRRLELDAYSSVISTFRAQGSLDTGKQGVLDQLRRCFHISEDRHKAEVRRVANSEKLTTISELLNGKSYDLEWIREGHRTYPLIARAPPYSALHILADHASKAAAIDNSELPEPADTRRSRIFDDEILMGKTIVTDDPTQPPPSPAIFGISRKELKKNLDFTNLQQSSRKKHFQHLKPPPPPNARIQHLYQTLNAKRPRKSLSKKSPKARVTKQSPGRVHLPYPPPPPPDDGGVELHRHLTSQLMPPPMSPLKTAYPPILPAGSGSKKDLNLLKMANHQQHQMEPQAHYIPNKVKRKSPGAHHQQKTNYQQRNGPNTGVGGQRIMDHIPDPQIIFNTTSSKSVDQQQQSMEHQQQHNNHDLDLSSQALQLLSTAASCTPKLKVTTPPPQPPSPSPQQQQIHQPQPPQPSTSTQALPLIPQGAVKRAIKIVPSTAKPGLIIKPNDPAMKPMSTQPSKFKIQKIQLLVNKTGQEGSANLSPSATIVSGKAGQLVLSGKGITNSYQVGSKQPFTIVSNPKPVGGPKVIVQTIDRSFSQDGSQQDPQRIPDNQRITENTPIDFVTSNFPKVIIQNPASKQIKLKLGTNLVNSKLIKGPIPASFKIQRNVNTKNFTVLNSSQIVQLQAQQAALPAQPQSEGKDWEQELENLDANRKVGKSATKSNGAGPVAKKIRLDEELIEEMIETVPELAPEAENVIVESVVDVADQAASLVVFDAQPPVDPTIECHQPNISNLVSEYVFLNNEEVETTPSSKSVEESPAIITVNGDESAELNGQVEEQSDERPPHNGAEAFESLVKSITCDNDYMKEMNDENQLEENYGLMENNILEQFNFTRESGLFQ